MLSTDDVHVHDFQASLLILTLELFSVFENKHELHSYMDVGSIPVLRVGHLQAGLTSICKAVTFQHSRSEAQA